MPKKARDPNHSVPSSTLDLLVAACQAVVKYDNALAGQAARGKVKLVKGGAIAEGELLDSLYVDMAFKTYTALQASGDLDKLPAHYNELKRCVLKRN